MKAALFVLLAILAHAFTDSPPIPYKTTSGAQVTSYPENRIHTGAEPYVDHFGTDGFSIQSGYEGYLIPASEHGILSLVEGLDLKGQRSHFLVFFKNLLSLGWKVIPKVALGAAVILVLFVVGGCVNVFVCSLTPFCTISFGGFGVNKDTMRSYLTPDRISSTATFVIDAIKKYKDMYENVSNEIDGRKKPK